MRNSCVRPMVAAFATRAVCVEPPIRRPRTRRDPVQRARLCRWPGDDHTSCHFCEMKRAARGQPFPIWWRSSS